MSYIFHVIKRQLSPLWQKKKSGKPLYHSKIANLTHRSSERANSRRRLICPRNQHQHRSLLCRVCPVKLEDTIKAVPEMWGPFRREMIPVLQRSVRVRTSSHPMDLLVSDHISSGGTALIKVRVPLDRWGKPLTSRLKVRADCSDFGNVGKAHKPDQVCNKLISKCWALRQT